MPYMMEFQALKKCVRRERECVYRASAVHTLVLLAAAKLDLPNTVLLLGVLLMLNVIADYNIVHYMNRLKSNSAQPLAYLLASSVIINYVMWPSQWVAYETVILGAHS